jgi:hypothetical protein
LRLTSPRAERGQRGLARFAESFGAYALLLQFCAALVCAAAAGRAAKTAWFPAVAAAVRSLPDTDAAIVNGRLKWPDSSPRILGVSRQLSVAVAPAQGAVPQGGDLQLELAPGAVRLRGLAGFVEAPYPNEFSVDLDAIHGRAIWEAWTWVVQLAIAGAVGTSLLVFWWLGGAVMAPILWCFARIIQRRPTLGGTWRMAATSWVGPSMAPAAAITLYGLNQLRLQPLLASFALHAILGPIWSIWAACRLPFDTSTRATTPNPFDNLEPEPKLRGKGDPFSKGYGDRK